MHWKDDLNFFSLVKKSGLFKAVSSFFVAVGGWFGMIRRDHATIGKVQKKVSSLSGEVVLLKQGDMAELHHQLYDSANRYIKQGYITTAQLDDLRIIYDSYHALNGNGTGTDLFNRCLKLPIKPIDF